MHRLGYFLKRTQQHSKRILIFLLKLALARRFLQLTENSIDLIHRFSGVSFSYSCFQTHCIMVRFKQRIPCLWFQKLFKMWSRDHLFLLLSHQISHLLLQLLILHLQRRSGLLAPFWFLELLYSLVCLLKLQFQTFELLALLRLFWRPSYRLHF